MKVITTFTLFYCFLSYMIVDLLTLLPSKKKKEYDF